MATLAASIIASMVIDDMLKDDGGVEATKLMFGRGKYKRHKVRHEIQKKNATEKMGAAASTLARAGARVATKSAAKAAARAAAKAAAKGAINAGASFGADAVFRKLSGGKRRRKAKRVAKRKIIGGKRKRASKRNRISIKARRVR